MKTFFTSITLLIFLASPVFGEFEITTSNLENAFEIPGSRSPNGEYALYCINRGETTATFIGIMPTNRESLEFETQLPPHGLDKKEYDQYLKVLWSSDSVLVAAHDSSKQHSRLSIYKAKNKSFTKITVPDLVAAMKKTLAQDVEIQSSGQIPISWIGSTDLLVLVRLKDKSGNIYTKQYKIKIVPISGEIIINTKE